MKIAERAGGRRHRLHDVVLEDRRVLYRAENRHRDDGGNRRSEGQDDLQTEIHVGGRKDRRDERAEDESSNCQFLGLQHGNSSSSDRIHSKASTEPT